jgi:aldehyde:ferredoxin oxidoreductase
MNAASFTNLYQQGTGQPQTRKSLEKMRATRVRRYYQLNNAGYDSPGACAFSGFGLAAASEMISELVNVLYGTHYDTGLLQESGCETIRYEREFNRRAGFTKADDRIPEWMRREPLPPLNLVFDVPDDELESIFEDL